jgi:hypothetical protein
MATSEIPFHSEQWSGLVTEDLEGKAERALAVWEDGLEDALTVRVLPENPARGGAPRMAWNASMQRAGGGSGAPDLPQ